MSGFCFQVPPRSKRNIATEAAFVRAAAGAAGPYFPLVDFIEKHLPLLWDHFTFVVQEYSEMRGAHGLTFPEESEIWLREDVYDGVLEGRGRDRFTLAHELGHLLMHGNVGLARVPRPSVELKHYENSEWQANTFAGALLVPDEIAISLGDPRLIAEQCGVSVEAATVRLKQVKRG